MNRDPPKQQSPANNPDKIAEAKRLQETVLSLMHLVASRMADQILAESDANSQSAKTSRLPKNTSA